MALEREKWESQLARDGLAKRVGDPGFVKFPPANLLIAPDDLVPRFGNLNCDPNVGSIPGVAKPFDTTPDSANLGVFRTSINALLPEIKTNGSACFDIRACVTPDQTDIIGYSMMNNKQLVLAVGKENANAPYSLSIPARSRALVPTGLILDIPDGYCVKLYSRSGLALKQGLTLANGVGIIDSDYVDPVRVIIENHSDANVRIYHGDRICQGELSKLDVPNIYLKPLTSPPKQKTNRIGGFGSTGVK